MLEIIGEDTSSALHLAVHGGFQEVVEALLEARVGNRAAVMAWGYGTKPPPGGSGRHEPKALRWMHSGPCRCGRCLGVFMAIS